MSLSQNAIYQVHLKRELSRRCEKNPKYSLRAFARALGVDAGALSRILAGKQTPSYKISQQMLKQLDLSPAEKLDFLSSVAEQCKTESRVPTERLLEILGDSASPVEIDQEIWQLIADWTHGAIMELTFVPHFKSDPAWIAKQLGITEWQARASVDRLIHFGLLERRKDTLVKTHKLVSSADKSMTTSAHRKLQRQFLEKAIHSLENDPIEERNMTSMAMAIDVTKLEEAKRLIMEFGRKLCTFLESGEQTRVYHLGINLYPVQSQTVTADSAEKEKQ